MFGGHAAILKNYLGWWADAGLIDAVADAPQPWLDAPAAPARAAPAGEAVASTAPAPQPAPPPPAAAAPAEPQTLPDTLPDTLDALDDWLATSPDLPGARWSLRRIAPTGPQAAPIMLLTDCPAESDIAAGRLFADAPGALLDAMLAAIGQTREALRIGSIALTRPLAGRMDPRDGEALVHIARHHIALARPRALLLIGERAARLISGEGVGIDGGDSQRIFNHGGVTVPAYAIHHPRLLLDQPALKKPTWEVLKKLKEV